MKSIFEEMGGTYRQVGDYLIPNLVLPDTGNYQIGKYGRMRRSYLKQYRKILYNNYVLRLFISRSRIESTRLSKFWLPCNERKCNCMGGTSALTALILKSRITPITVIGEPKL